LITIFVFIYIYMHIAQTPPRRLEDKGEIIFILIILCYLYK
jgi:hypothetical protein